MDIITLDVYVTALKHMIFALLFLKKDTTIHTQESNKYVFERKIVSYGFELISLEFII